ncbi:MAG: hypothetical protein Tsb0021_01870 [Chlamydiales bacterium]
MEQSISGYIVVYLPKKCRTFFESKNGKNWDYKPTIQDGLEYRGLYRSQWEELTGAYYQNNLPQELEKIFLNMKSKSNQFVRGVLINQNYNETKEILNFSNQKYSESSEIIAIYSDLISRTQGEMFSQEHIIWIGYDVVKIASWSFIEYGVMNFEPMFVKWKNSLNQYGLIPDTNASEAKKMADALIIDYENFANQKVLEPLSGDRSYIDTVRIGILSEL